MSNNIAIPVPKSDELYKLGHSRIYDKNPLKIYYRKKKYALMNNKVGLETSSEVRKGSNDRMYLEGFDEWLNKNFVKNPSWLKGMWREDPEYRLKQSSSQGSYIEFDTSELLNGGPFLDAYLVKGDDIVYGYKKHSLKTELSSTGKDGLKGSLVKISNRKWRIYLNRSSAPKGSTSVAKPVASAAKETVEGATDKLPSTSRTSTISSTNPTSSTSPTSSTDFTTSTSSTTTTDSTTDTSSTASTDSTSTRSFDFLDDILGAQKEDSKDKTTELDPNQVANAIVSETKLNDAAISSLVSTYLNSLHKINRSYNTQTK